MGVGEGGVGTRGRNTLSKIIDEVSSIDGLKAAVMVSLL